MENFFSILLKPTTGIAKHRPQMEVLPVSHLDTASSEDIEKTKSLLPPSTRTLLDMCTERGKELDKLYALLPLLSKEFEMVKEYSLKLVIENRELKAKLAAYEK